MKQYFTLIFKYHKLKDEALTILTSFPSLIHYLNIV